jgi:hypothetical protein
VGKNRPRVFHGKVLRKIFRLKTEGNKILEKIIQ